MISRYVVYTHAFLGPMADDMIGQAYDRVAGQIAAAAARGVHGRPRPRPRPVPSSRDLVMPFTALSIQDEELATQDTATHSDSHACGAY